jgi:hypothetical protein
MGYLLANERSETFLGDFELELGIYNRVIPFSNEYVIDSNLISNYEKCNKRYNSTKNITRTVAYIIKGLLGCTFQSIIEKSSFDEIWQMGKSGETDLKNLYGFKNSYAFIWNDLDIISLQKDLQVIFENETLDVKLDKLLDTICEEIITKKTVVFSGENLKEINQNIGNAISNDLREKYLDLVKSWSTTFNSRFQENPCEMYK